MCDLNRCLDRKSKHDHAEKIAEPKETHIDAVVVKGHNVAVLAPLDVVKSQQALSKVEHEVDWNKPQQPHFFEEQIV